MPNNKHKMFEINSSLAENIIELSSVTHSLFALRQLNPYKTDNTVHDQCKPPENLHKHNVLLCIYEYNSLLNSPWILVTHPASYLHPRGSHGQQPPSRTHNSEPLNQHNQGVCENTGSTASVRGCRGPQSILPPMRCWFPCAETDEQTLTRISHLSSAGWEIPEPSPDKHTPPLDRE